MAATRDVALACPYCGRQLQWIPGRWFGRGCFECETCGEFPDLGSGAMVRSRQPQVAAHAPALPPRRDNRPRLLLVDDSAEHRDLYALMLEPTATVVTAANGEEALRLAPSASVDAIVLDVLMPHMDGWEVCRRLKADPATAAVPVIMLTSLDEDDIAARAQRSGAAAVLMKPCPVERLAAALAESIGAVSVRPPARHATPSRRWTRKMIATPVAVRVAQSNGWLLNVSYGGFCAELEDSPAALPHRFDLTCPHEKSSVRAELVWLRRGPSERWLCGAQVSNTNDRWRGWVDAVA